MLPIREVIRRIRVALHDEEQRINYSEAEILDAINLGLRVIRRSIAELQPEILMMRQTSTLEAGQSEIELERRSLLLIEVRADGRKLIETNLHHIRKEVGRPKYFYRVDLQSLKVHPKPSAETSIEVRFVEDLTELKLEDETPLLNEFDMTQEQQIIANIHQQIASLLAPPPTGAVVQGYW